ncbi:MAG: hypothetical protein IJW67_09185 [Blautia sp.]|nr:hypothetical protein [Blautia sp.]
MRSGISGAGNCSGGSERVENEKAENKKAENKKAENEKVENNEKEQPYQDHNSIFCTYAVFYDPVPRSMAGGNCRGAGE